MTLAHHKRHSIEDMLRRANELHNEVDTAILGESTRKDRPGDQALIELWQEIGVHLFHIKEGLARLLREN